ncbi:MAG: phosphodiester glycosidase family protein [Candidatus Eiseniibacteriota bacterium]
MRRAAAVAAAMLVAAAAGCGSGAGKQAPATLSVRIGDSSRPFWRADRAPARWDGPDVTLTRSFSWENAAPGVDWGTFHIVFGAKAWRAQVIVVRLDPRVVDLSLVMDLTKAEKLPAWSIDRAPTDAILAVNAGQFVNTMPWGWVMAEGRQLLPPGEGPLASAIAIDRAGNVRWSHGDSLADVANVVTGFQSYPTLLAGDGVVPQEVRTGGAGVNLHHRDSRLALGETRDGKLLIAMTRFDAVGDVAGPFPLGPTTPEMAAIMGALGASDAVALDGGISAQMVLRPSAGGPAHEWKGIRKVPLALIVRRRG